MVEYIIVYKKHDYNKGMGKYAEKENSKTETIHFNIEGRLDFLNKIDYLKKEDFYHESIKIYEVNYDKISIIELKEEDIEKMLTGP